MTKNEKKVHQYVKEYEQAAIDDISLYCDWPQSKLAIIQLEMEIKSLIVSLLRKTYILI